MNNNYAMTADEVLEKYKSIYTEWNRKSEKHIITSTLWDHSKGNESYAFGNTCLLMYRSKGEPTRWKPI